MLKMAAKTVIGFLVKRGQKSGSPCCLCVRFASGRNRWSGVAVATATVLLGIKDLIYICSIIGVVFETAGQYGPV